MKKAILLSISLLTFINVNSQITGGGEVSEKKKKKTTTISAPAIIDATIENKVYLNLNRPIPSGELSAGISAGWGLDWGVHKYFNKLNLPANMKLGFDYGISWNYTVSDYDDEKLHFVAYRIGVVYSFMVNKDFILDTKVTFQPTAFFTMEYIDKAEISYRRGLGFYGNYKAFTFGVEFNTGKIEDTEYYFSRYDLVIGFNF